MSLLGFLVRGQKQITRKPNSAVHYKTVFNGSIKHLPYTGLIFTDMYEMLLLKRHITIVISAALKHHGPRMRIC